jgi:FixJ family two-component response regulator
MIFPPAQAAYFWYMESLLPPGNLSLRRLSVEDQLLNSAAIISIVDDDESMRSALKSLMASLGLKAHAFASAEQFLQSQRLDDTACLITDLQMPGLNGIELQNLLLAQGRHIPIIFVTAFAEEPMRARALKAGALGFLSKPFESQTLAALIEKAIDTSRKT